MTHPGDAVGPAGRPRPSPQRLRSGAGSTALVLLAGLVLAVAVRRTTLSFATPAGLNRAPQVHTVVWTPGVVATVVASIAALASVALAVRTWIASGTQRLWWWATGGLVLLAAIWTMVTTTLSTPSF